MFVLGFKESDRVTRWQWSDDTSWPLNSLMCQENVSTKTLS